MDVWELGQLVAFLVLVSAPLILLELGMRRVARSRAVQDGRVRPPTRWARQGTNE